MYFIPSIKYAYNNVCKKHHGIQIGMMMVQTSHQREKKKRERKKSQKETFLSVSYETGVDFSRLVASMHDQLTQRDNLTAVLFLSP